MRGLRGRAFKVRQNEAVFGLWRFSLLTGEVLRILLVVLVLVSFAVLGPGPKLRIRLSGQLFTPLRVLLSTRFQIV
jgi:hypothetical protein